jgi:hypothetical protein
LEQPVPLFKTDSGKDKQTIPPRQWTLVRFADRGVITLPAQGWTIMGVLLRVEYPARGCPRTLRGRFMRWPDTPQEDATGFDDQDPIPGQTRHHYWSHFILNRPALTVGFKVWHDGTNSVTLDGRQFKWTRFK